MAKVKKHFNFMVMLAGKPSKSSKKGIGPSDKAADDMISKSSAKRLAKK